MTVIPRFLAALLLISPLTHAQDTLPKTYDVSTVKPAATDTHGMMLNWGDAELKAQNVTIEWILTSAFHARTDQISGLPGWAHEKHFDITAKLVDVDKDALKHMTAEKNRELLLALLVERFGLKYHLEAKDMPIYELVPAKTGLKLTPAKDCDDESKRAKGACNGSSSYGSGEIKGAGLTMPFFAELLGNTLHRDVHDLSGFTEKIDVNFKWLPDLDANPSPNPSPDPSPQNDNLDPLPTALEKQMGLHLVSTKGPVKLYVIDHLDPPSAN